VNRDTGGFCTGTLITRDLVLTARHCLYTRQVGRLPAVSMHFVAGYRFGRYDEHQRAARLFAPDEDGPAWDFAVFRLGGPMAIQPVRLATAADLRGYSAAASHVVLAGYSGDRPHLLSLDEQCIMLGTVGDALWRHTCDGPTGASGGPILVRTGDDPEDVRVAGITIGFTNSGSAPHGVMIPASAIRDFLRRQDISVD